MNEHLTQYYRNLMWQLKNKKDENRLKTYKFVWFRNNKLLAKQTDASNVKHIRFINVM